MSQTWITFFFCQGVLSLTTHRTAGERKEPSFIPLDTSSICSRTFRYSFATLYMRWLSHIFNHTACIYQTATRWDLPPYRITIYLIDHVMHIFVCLLDDLILGFCYSNLTRETGRLELAPPITLVLQTNRLTNCPTQPNTVLNKLFGSSALF